MPSSQLPSTPPESNIYVGPAGWSYADWAGIVYPTRRPSGFHGAAYLAEYFDTIEINVSFYRPIPARDARRWVERVAHNPRFLFTAKLWKEFTHEQQLTAENERAFRPAAEVLLEEKKLGALLAQFPWSFKNTADNRDYLAQLAERFRQFPLVVELRHASWNRPEFCEWLAEQGIGFCNIDQPVIGRSLKPTQYATAPVGYIRLHGRNYDQWFSDDPEATGAERYNYLYSTEELQPWVERIRAVAQGRGAVFVVTNNHFRGQAPTNALQLVHLLNRKPVKVPPSLLRHYPQLGTIAMPESPGDSLFA